MGPRGGADRPGPAGAGRAGRPVPRRTLRWRAAAGGDRPRGGRGSTPAARRRTVRSAGLGERRGGDAAGPRDLPGRRRRRRRHARRAAGLLGRPGGVPAGRAGGGFHRAGRRTGDAAGPGPRTMSTTLAPPTPVTARPPARGGAPARRAIRRWAWRLLRREWRQQVLILALLTLAVGT